MYRGAIITITDNNNFGNRLQNAAVEYILMHNGIECSTIWDKEEKTIIKKIKKIIKGLIPSKKYPTLRRIRKFNDFTNTYTTPDYIGFNNKVFEKYDYIFVGSDQIFNRAFLKKLSFLKECNKNIIAVSPSFGAAEINQTDVSDYKELLGNFSRLSVREREGQELIKELLPSTKVSLLVDPTMAVPRKYWDNVAKPIPYRNKYILLYFLGEMDETTKNEIMNFAVQKKLDVINLLDRNTKYYNIGPSEFIYLIKQAEYVFTDSFHACAFSIIYNKNFLVFKRKNQLYNMFSRITTLLDTFKLNNRIFNGKIISNELECDYSDANKILEIETKKFNDYIN